MNMTYVTCLMKVRHRYSLFCSWNHSKVVGEATRLWAERFGVQIL